MKKKYKAAKRGEKEHTYDEAEIAQVIDCLFKSPSVAYVLFKKKKPICRAYVLEAHAQRN